MKWFKKPQDLYDLLLLEDLFFGDSGSFARRVPGGWVFHHSPIPAGMVGAVHPGTFVPYNDEFLNLSDENTEILAEKPASMDTEDPTEETADDPGKIGHQRRIDGESPGS